MGEEDELSPPSKRIRLADSIIHSDSNDVEDGAKISGGTLTLYDGGDTQLRTSSLKAPTLRLTGHKSSVYCLAYDNAGECFCSGSFDKTCLLWNASNGSYDNYNVLEGHKNAILDLKFNLTDEHIVTASADKTLGWYDAYTGKRVKRFSGHKGIVNAVDVPRPSGSTKFSSSAPYLVASASDDRSARIWDARVRGHVMKMDHEYQVTAVAIGADTTTIYTGGLDNLIHAYDLRGGDASAKASANNVDQVDIPVRKDYASLSQGQKIMSMKGHKDTITSLSVSPGEGKFLLSQSMDCTLKSWDIRPYVPEGQKRCLKTFVGSTHNAERGLLKCSWSADASMVAGGSADRVVHIWDEYSSEELYYLPGHSGCVNSVIFHPIEKNVVASASSDNTIFVGELAS